MSLLLFICTDDCHCGLDRLSRSFIFNFLLRNRNSASVSLILSSESILHVSAAKIMSINGILLVAGTKFGPRFSRDFCSSVNFVLVKLMTACLIFDVIFCLLFSPVLFFSISNLLIRWFLFFFNYFSLNIFVLQSISAKYSSFVLLFKFSQICFTITVALSIRWFGTILFNNCEFPTIFFHDFESFLVFIGLFSLNDFFVMLWCTHLCKKY